MIKPDPTTFQMIKIQTEAEGWTCEWRCTECNWTVEYVVTKKNKDGLTETFCPKCLSEDKCINNN